MNKKLWIVAAVFVVILVCGGIWFYHAGNKNAYQASVQQLNPSASTSVPADTVTTTATGIATTSSPTATLGGYFSERTNSALGTYLADENGLTLYVYSKDAANVSNCTDACLQTWVSYAYGPGISASGTFNMPMLPADAGTTKGNNGMVQFTWKKMPLYRFAQDKKPGDVSGQGLGGVWSVVKM